MSKVAPLAQCLPTPSPMPINGSWASQSCRTDAAQLPTAELVFELGDRLAALRREFSRHETLARLALDGLPEQAVASDTEDLLHVLLERLDGASVLFEQLAGHVDEYVARAQEGGHHG